MKEDSISLDDVLGYLNRFHLSRALNVIGILYSLLPWDPTEEASSNHSKFQPMVDWVNAEFNDVGARRSFQINLARLARYLLLSQAADYKDTQLRFDDGSFQMAFTMVSQMFDPKAEAPLVDDHDPHWWMFRTIQWQFPLQENPATWLSRAYLLFNLIPKQSGFYDELEELVLDAAGMTPIDFMSTCFCIAVINQGVVKRQKPYGVDRLDFLLSDENLAKLLTVASCTKEEYIANIRGDTPHEVDAENDIYKFEPLTTCPIVRFPSKLVGVDDIYTLPIATYLLQKGSIGLFYLVCDYLQNTVGNDASKGFRTSFGARILSPYVHEQLLQSLDSTRKCNSLWS